MPLKRTWIWPASLLIVATLVIGAIVFVLMDRESKRLRQISLNTVEEQCRAVADNLGLIVLEAKSVLIDSLQEFQGARIENQLEAWVDESELAEFAFVWRVEAPNQLSLISNRDNKSLQRKILIDRSNAWLWQSTPEEASSRGFDFRKYVAADTSEQELLELAANSSVSNYASNTVQRQSIRQKGITSSKLAKSRFQEPTQWTLSKTQWLPKRQGNAFYWIGLTYWQDESIITGVALNLANLEGAFRDAYPLKKSASILSFSLIDERGTHFAKSLESYRKGSPPPSKQDVRIDLEAELPGWKLSAALSNGIIYTDIVFLLGAATIGALLLTLLASGIWLVWQARSSEMEAARKAGFVSNVSHELKTPLTTIRMYCELIREDRIKDQDKRHRYLDTVLSECQRLTRLVNNVLDFSRLERGKTNLNARRYNLREFLSNYIEMRRREFELADFELETDLTHSDTTLAFDRDALAQIIGNLVDNALKYASDGKWLGIQVERRAETLSIVISDKGPGIPQDRQSRIFESFERLETTLASGASGFGLGLSIAKGLAEQMRLELHYRKPRNGTGSAFEITFSTN